MAMLVEHYICRFNITMNNTVGMKGLDCFGELSGNEEVIAVYICG
jgi:hypothetical protein